MTDPFERPARPWDLFNKNLGRVADTIQKERMLICSACPELSAVGTCNQCGCFMAQKTKLPNAECPVHKWGQVRVTFKDESEPEE